MGKRENGQIGKTGWRNNEQGLLMNWALDTGKCQGGDLYQDRLKWKN